MITGSKLKNWPPMDKGFLFDNDRCVDCKACIAACILENGWTVKPRTVFTFNNERLTYMPVINLSMACNHCEIPVCLDGCPSGAIYRHPGTGAIVVDEAKCLGCKYCIWNCPYDAPKFDENKRVIGKCHLCYNGFSEGRIPACTSACPTGALSFGKLNDIPSIKSFPWLPDKKLKPSLMLTGHAQDKATTVVPADKFEPELKKTTATNNSRKGIWVLVLFTYLITLSVSAVLKSLIDGTFPQPGLFCLSIIIAGLVSLLHLGRKIRAWRAPVNIRRSPLSREIAAFILYSVLSCVAVILRMPGLLLVSSAAGLILLIFIDAVYYFADRSRKIIFHSGQTFLSALIIISFLTNNVLPFLFIALLKLASSFFSMTSLQETMKNFSLRFMRFAILLITGVMLISGRYEINNIVILVFLSGELLDRILFYIDFKPVNINDLIYNNEIIFSNEKKRN